MSTWTVILLCLVAWLIYRRYQRHQAAKAAAVRAHFAPMSLHPARIAPKQIHALFDEAYPSGDVRTLAQVIACTPWIETLDLFRLCEHLLGWSRTHTWDLIPKLDPWKAIFHGSEGWYVPDDRAILFATDLKLEQPEVFRRLHEIMVTVIDHRQLSLPVEGKSDRFWNIWMAFYTAALRPDVARNVLYYYWRTAPNGQGTESQVYLRRYIATLAVRQTVLLGEPETLVFRRYLTRHAH